MKKYLLFAIVTNLLGSNIQQATTFEADFTQSISNSQKTIKYTGHLYVKKPNNLLWVYIKPQKKVYINAQTAIIEETRLQQTIISSLDKEINFLNILNSATTIKQNLLEAKIKGVSYFLYLNEQGIEKITYKDSLENDIEIKFTNQKINHSLSDGLFKYNLPKGFDVVRK